MTNLIETPDKVDPAEPFAKMSLRVTHNADEGFAGAFVIVPPQGDPVEMLVLNSTPNAAVFWSLLKTTAEMAIAEIEDKQRASQGFGYR